MKTKGLIQSLLLLSGVLCVGIAQAGIILPAGIAALEDDNLEYVLDSNGAVKTSGALAVGDTLVAYITFDKVQTGGGSTVQELGAPSQELTGISMLTIVGFSGTNDIIFAPSAGLAGFGAGTVAVLYEQGAGDFFDASTCGSVGACDGVATNGNLWMTAGIVDDDDFWFFDGFGPGPLQTIESVAGTPSGTTVGTANYALSIITNNTGYTFDKQLCVFCTGTDQLVDIIGSGQVLGGSGLSTPFFARSDFDFVLNRVPEPASLALMALGLLGLSGFSRRRNLAS